MEFQKVIELRRSIRKYDAEKKVPKEMLCELIQAALEAPSWKNSQTGRYYCVMSDEMVKKFKAECLPKSNAARCADAPALIVAAYERNRSGFEDDGATPRNELGNGWGIYDLGLATEHLTLKAAELGLGTLIMGIRDADQIRALLGIPETEQIVSVIAVGYPDQEPKKPVRKSVEDVTKFF